jgi:hypothetical protein
MQGGLTIWLVLVILHIMSIVIPLVTTIIDNSIVQKLIFWLFNIIAPNINAQVIITYILARKSAFCKLFLDPLNTLGPKIFKSIGDDTIEFNWLILCLHILIFLLILILNDSGLLKFSFLNSYKSEFNENILDDDVLAERHRILNLNYSSTSQNTINIDNEEQEEQETDHLIVHDLTKRYPGRHVLAVNHLTFGAKRGEAFGLLGYNVSH